MIVIKNLLKNGTQMSKKVIYNSQIGNKAFQVYHLNNKTINDAPKICICLFHA